MRAPLKAGATLLTATLFVVPGCRCSSQESALLPAPSGSVSAGPRPRADRLDPNEIPEGTQSAFDLKIPRGMKITLRTPEEVHAVSRHPPERIANYVRKRVEVDGVELGAARTVFNRARVRGEPTGRLLRIEVLVTWEGTSLVVQDLTPPKIDPNLSEEERWKKHGLDPNGNLVDPMQ